MTKQTPIATSTPIKLSPGAHERAVAWGKSVISAIDNATPEQWEAARAESDRRSRESNPYIWPTKPETK